LREMVEGDKVEHDEYGIGVVEGLLGGIIRVNFFGELIDVRRDELKVRGPSEPLPVEVGAGPQAPDLERAAFRRSFEAINLGIIPPDPSQLIKFTMGAESITKQIINWLESYRIDGLCKAVFGYYGSGKSHLLNLVKCVALELGWVVSYVEFDPKEADPAKPHLVYRNLMANLEFPPRHDGSKTEGFFDFIKEIRDSWYSKSIKSLELFKDSPWFSTAIEILIHYPHSEDQSYQAACNWLAGDYKSYDQINSLGREKGYRRKAPRMPVTKETGEIYVHHLSVIGHLCAALGYKGLMIILDEAEHVRGYNVRRRERANNFFDLLALCSHRPLEGASPYLNEHGFNLPPYWLHGPHFGLFVGLTEGDTFADPDTSVRDACVFAHDLDDCIFIKPPLPEHYGVWCQRFFLEFHRHYPSQTKLLANKGTVQAISESLAEMFGKVPIDTAVLRNWTKIAGLVLCILLSRKVVNASSLMKEVEQVAGQYLGFMPWEE